MKRLVDSTKYLLFDKSAISIVSGLLFLVEIALGLYVIHNVAYTEIDWVAYMQQVQIFLNGTLDYDKLIGQTGPCVYPAGHVYVYTMLYYVSGGGTNIHTVQLVFLGLYLLSIGLIFNIYRSVLKVPPFVLFFMCLASYRVHSIYLLRLFNDPVAMFFFYASINFCLYSRFSLASIFFSLAVSVKMNILLSAPAFLFVLLLHRGLYETLGHLAECGIVQLLLGSIFLFRNTEAYLGAAFEFSRQFMYKWTVNWKILPESVFLDRRFHVTLLAIHILLLVFFLARFIRSRGGLMRFLALMPPGKRKEKLNPEDVIYPIFVANFVGIAFSRSLHYQFYVWYYHTIPYLLWSVPAFSNPVRLLLFGLIEVSWNVYPSTAWSSANLHACHLILLVGLAMSALPACNTPSTKKSTGSSTSAPKKLKKS
nr:unnamed protein product [Spirometra erinaceieuropaei]